jgi:putative modified peptide
MPLSLTPDVAEKVLDRLASDDSYREAWLGDPAKALSEYGVQAKAEELPAVRNLPSKAVIQANRDAIRDSLVRASGAAMLMFLAHVPDQK